MRIWRAKYVGHGPAYLRHSMAYVKPHPTRADWLVAQFDGHHFPVRRWDLTHAWAVFPRRDFHSGGRDRRPYARPLWGNDPPAPKPAPAPFEPETFARRHVDQSGWQP